MDGFSIDPALVRNADPVLRDIGLSNDAANKLLPVARDIMARTQENLVRQIEDAARAGTRRLLPTRKSVARGVAKPSILRRRHSMRWDMHKAIRFARPWIAAGLVIIPT